MKNKLASIILTSFAVFFIPNIVFAFGEVAGPVVFYVPIGGSNNSMWGIFNNESVAVSISAEGDAAKYLSFPQNFTLQPNNQIYWINLTANIPSDYNVTQEKNITGVLYAVAQGQPGQVQINLRLKKNMYVLVGESQKTNSVSEKIPTNLFTGFFALQPAPILSVIATLAVIFGLFFFIKGRKGG